MDSGMDVAGKTGTTSDSKDLWFVGYTPYLTAGIWLGYDQSYSMEGVLNETEHETLWGKIMNRIDTECGFEAATFTVPDSVGTRTVCSKSGKLVVTSVCTAITEYFDLNALPEGYCNDHIGATICDVCGGLATENSPSSTYTEYSYSYQIPTTYCTCTPETETEEDTEGNGSNGSTTTPSTVPSDPTAPTPVG
jgi:penicillin-binding protein 1A